MGYFDIRVGGMKMGLTIQLFHTDKRKKWGHYLWRKTKSCQGSHFVLSSTGITNIGSTLPLLVSSRINLCNGATISKIRHIQSRIG